MKIPMDENIDETLEKLQKEFTSLSTARSAVIDSFITIEGFVNQALFYFINPSEDSEDTIKDILLDTSTLDTSKKFKLLRAFANNFKYSVEYPASDVSKLLESRNVFAHASGEHEVVINPDDKTRNILTQLVKVSGSGIPKKVPYAERLAEYHAARAVVFNYVLNLFGWIASKRNKPMM